MQEKTGAASEAVIRLNWTAVLILLMGVGAKRAVACEASKYRLMVRCNTHTLMLSCEALHTEGWHASQEAGGKQNCS